MTTDIQNDTIISHDCTGKSETSKNTSKMLLHECKNLHPKKKKVPENSKNHILKKIVLSIRILSMISSICKFVETTYIKLFSSMLKLQGKDVPIIT